MVVTVMFGVVYCRLRCGVVYGVLCRGVVSCVWCVVSSVWFGVLYGVGVAAADATAASAGVVVVVWWWWWCS